MLRDDVLQVINSGEAWGFVGAGSSMDAGMPSWGTLVSAVCNQLDKALKASKFEKQAFDRALEKKDYPLAFGILEDAVGRDLLEHEVRIALPDHCSPGALTRAIADLPFAGYITTNYDSILEVALAKSGAWVPIGNSQLEVPKVSGDVRDVIWHLHGSLKMPSDRSGLILTDRDYDSMYLDGSPAMTQLRGLLAHRRAVFVGFSFADQELIRLLKVVGRLTDATRPAFAFVPAQGDFRHDIDRAVFKRQHNVELIPYKVSGDSHKALLDTLSVYSSLTLRRSITLGSAKFSVPESDPSTTGLLIYNEFANREEVNVGVDSLRDGLLDSHCWLYLRSRHVRSSRSPRTSTLLRRH